MKGGAPVAFALLTIVLLLSGCAGDTDSGAAVTVDEAPEWVTKIYPPPGANTTATRAVQVQYETVGADREVRLLIDGTDVTTYARVGTGLLEYDVDQAASPVELDPGPHTATVELYEVKVGASEGAESYSASERAKIDSFSWDFQVS